MAAAGAAAKGATARRDGATSTGAGGAGTVEEALHSGGAASATAGRACSATTIMVQINFTRPDEAELWEASPWYSDGALSNGASKEQSRLSSQPYGRRYALTCDPAEAHKVVDDGWLYKRWLSELEEELAAQVRFQKFDGKV